MQNQLGDTSYFHRFVRWFATLQGLLMLALILGASSSSAAMTETPGDVVMLGVTAVFRSVFSWFKSIPALA